MQGQYYCITTINKQIYKYLYIIANYYFETSFINKVNNDYKLIRFIIEELNLNNINNEMMQ